MCSVVTKRAATGKVVPNLHASKGPSSKPIPLSAMIVPPDSGPVIGFDPVTRTGCAK